jgi:mono/diheme cytochrome c family protein
MRYRFPLVVAGLSILMTTGGVALVAAQTPPSTQTSPPAQPGVGPGRADRAKDTREFLGLGVEPDKAAATRGAPLFASNCSFCHGPQGRGAEGPSLIVSDVVLGDDHGEKMVPFLKKGRPEKGMPSFDGVPADQLRDIVEFLHLQVENYTNRGTYQVLNIVVGDRDQGKAYFGSHCASCHSVTGDLAGIGRRFKSPSDLQRGWVWPSRESPDGRHAVTARVTSPTGTVFGRLTQISDFKVTVTDAQGVPHVITRDRGVKVAIQDPLAPHEAMIPGLADKDMHNVTAYLDSLK